MFATENELNGHIEDMIDNGLTFECNKKDCPFETNLMCAWNQHFHTHVKTFCEHCELAFSSITELDGHAKKQHEIVIEETSVYKCEQCKQEFNCLENQESHECKKVESTSTIQAVENPFDPLN